MKFFGSLAIDSNRPEESLPPGNVGSRLPLIIGVKRS